jgi:pimeloyl-ACP methyl ester carboxylesterase
MPAFPAPRRLQLPARRLPTGRESAPIALSVHEAGSGPAVVLCHGFPELAYSWRHQLPALAAAGFRAVAPDQRGYGASDRPGRIEDYDIHHLTGDLVGLLDALGIERAVFVGHDWGGLVTWSLPALHASRVAGLVGVNTPNLPRSVRPPTEMMRMLVGGRDEKMYILWFQKPGVADAVLDANVAIVFDRLMRGGSSPAEAVSRAASMGFDPTDMNPFRRLPELPAFGEPLLSPEEMDVFVGTFERTGFTGGINWYRNMDRNWETATGVGATRIEVPCLMVTAEWDPVLRPEMAAGMGALIPDLETHLIPKCGHWTQQEAPDALNRILVDWLTRKFGQGRS